MPRQLTLDEPRQLDLLTSSGRPIVRSTVDENDDSPRANARFGPKRPALADLVDEVGDCYACGMPALAIDTGRRRECIDCGRGLCDPVAGCDCSGPGVLRPGGPVCWDCYHAEDDDDAN